MIDKRYKVQIKPHDGGGSITSCRPTPTEALQLVKAFTELDTGDVRAWREERVPGIGFQEVEQIHPIK